MGEMTTRVNTLWSNLEASYQFRGEGKSRLEFLSMLVGDKGDGVHGLDLIRDRIQNEESEDPVLVKELLNKLNVFANNWPKIRAMEDIGNLESLYYELLNLKLSSSFSEEKVEERVIDLNEILDNISRRPASYIMGNITTVDFLYENFGVLTETVIEKEGKMVKYTPTVVDLDRGIFIFRSLLDAEKIQEEIKTKSFAASIANAIAYMYHNKIAAVCFSKFELDKKKNGTFATVKLGKSKLTVKCKELTSLPNNKKIYKGTYENTPYKEEVLFVEL